MHTPLSSQVKPSHLVSTLSTLYSTEKEFHFVRVILEDWLICFLFVAPLCKSHYDDDDILEKQVDNKDDDDDDNNELVHISCLL